MLKQRTLKSLTRAVGVGLHSGRAGGDYAAPGAGVHRHHCSACVHLPEVVDIPALATAVRADTRLASTLSVGNAKVHTVEHLMLACAGLGINNPGAC